MTGHVIGCPIIVKFHAPSKIKFQVSMYVIRNAYFTATYLGVMLDVDLTTLVFLLALSGLERTSGESAPLVQESEESKFRPVPLLLRGSGPGEELTSSCKAL